MRLRAVVKKGLRVHIEAKVGCKRGSGLGLGRRREHRSRGDPMAGTEVLQQDPPKVRRRVSLRKSPPQRHQTALPRSRQHAGPRQGQAPLSSTRSAQDRVDAAQSPVPELNPKSQPPTPPIQEPENPIPRPHPQTWLSSSDPNPGPRHRRHAPVSSLLGCAQCRPAGQSRRQQVKGEGAAGEDQEEAEQGAHLGASTRTRPAAEEPGSSARNLATIGLLQRSALVDGQGRGSAPGPAPISWPHPRPGFRLQLAPESSRKLFCSPSALASALLPPVYLPTFISVSFSTYLQALCQALGGPG